MDIAIVTGANTRIGLAISRKLIETGCRVFGLGNDFDDFPLEHTDFVPVTCDLTNTQHLCQVVQEIIDKEKNIYVLVNHARCLKLEPHEKLGLNDIESLVHTNLLAPLILTRLALPSLIRLRGYVLNIGFPDLPGSQRLGSAFLSTEVALQRFSDRLYEEVRQDKVKVCSLVLDVANAEAMFNEGFTERENHDLILCAEAVAQAVEYVISQKRESVVSTLVIRPQKREPVDKDRHRVRKLVSPKPYRQKEAAKKVVVGRLQKEQVQADEKSPTTYMDMAREVAEEESTQPSMHREKPQDVEGNLSERKEHSNRRRRRRRDRSKAPSKREENVPRTANHDKDRRQNSQKSAIESAKSKQNKIEPKTPAIQERPVKKRPAKKSVRKTAPVKKLATKKVVTVKQAPTKPTKNVVSKKTVAKKKTVKRDEKKVVKKTARRRRSSENPGI